MSVEIVTPRTLPHILEWYGARGQNAPPADWFGFGLWVPDVAAAFLYPTPRRIYLEDVTTNPEATSEVRHTALGELFAGIMIEVRAIVAATEGPPPYLVGWSHEPDIAARAGRLGFEKIGSFTGFVRRL